MPGAEAFLAAARRTHFTALLSSTPDPVLLEILTRRRWVDYFHLIRGAPVDKAEWLSSLRQRGSWSRRQLVFFGDTLEDTDSALEADCLFVGVANPHLQDRGYLFLKDFSQLPLPAGVALP